MFSKIFKNFFLSRDLGEILSSLDAVVWEADVKSLKINYVSKKAEELFGYAREEWMSPSFFWEKMIHPDDREKALNFCRQNSSQQLPRRFECRVNSKDGKIIWVENIITLKLKNSLPHSLSGIMIDISERKNAEEEVLQRRELLRIAHKLGRIGSWEWNVESDFVTCSESLYEIFGMRPEEFNGNARAALSTVYAEDKQIIVRAAMKALSTGVVDPVDFRINNPREGIRYIHGEAVLIKDNSGKIMKAIGSFQDITERKKNELILIESSKLVALGEMASGMAHEINNPLTIVISSLGLLREKLSSERITKEETLKNIERIENASERVSKIMKSLKIFSGAKSDVMECIDIAAIGERVMRAIQSKLSAENIKIHTEWNDLGTTKIECQSGLLVQMLLNLINNSIHAVKKREEKWIKVSLQKVNGLLEISITDSGQGIDSRVASKMMQPFYTTKDVGEGMGLGLSISKGIAEVHNGRFYYDPASSNTRFVVELPAIL